MREEIILDRKTFKKWIKVLGKHNTELRELLHSRKIDKSTYGLLSRINNDKYEWVIQQKRDF